MRQLHETDFSPIESLDSLVEDCVESIDDRYLDEKTEKGVTATIYSKGRLGIDKMEGSVISVSKSGVVLMKKRGRSQYTLMTWYAPFWMVVAGHGHPDPDGVWQDAKPSTTPGVTTQQSKYRSTDPRWVDEFLDGPGKGLRVLAMVKDGNFSNPGNLPETSKPEEG